MIKVTKVRTRPSVDVPFRRQMMPIELRSYREDTYVSTGKLLSEQTTFSEDRLTMTYVAVWADRESFDAYDADPLLNAFWAARDAAQLDSGIVAQDRTIEEL